MKLFYSPNSPYARKCRVTALEKGLEKTVDFVKVDPWENAPELMSVNPLGTVPALVTNAGMALCESPIICEYLDTLSPKPKLFPADMVERLKVLGLAALADGVTDAAVSCVIETMKRPEDKRWQGWVDRKHAAIKRTLALIAPHAEGRTPLSIGTIALAVALGYVSFRLPQLDWRKQHPELAGWFDDFSKRPSMQATRPIA